MSRNGDQLVRLIGSIVHNGFNPGPAPYWIEPGMANRMLKLRNDRGEVIAVSFWSSRDLIAAGREKRVILCRPNKPNDPWELVIRRQLPALHP